MKLFKVIRRSRFIDVEDNPINVGLYEVVENECDTYEEVSVVFENFKSFKFNDDNCMITTDEHRAYYHCSDLNYKLSHSIMQEVGHKILYESIKK